MVQINNLQEQNTPLFEWFQSLPIITRCWFTATVVCTLTGNFGVIEPKQFLWIWPLVKSRFELWRALTSFCYAGPFSFDTLITIYMMYTMSLRYETGSPFNTGAGGGTADYAFAWLLAAAFILLTFPLVVTIFPFRPMFARNMVYFVMYIWSKRNPTAQANIWGIPMPAIWLPFVYLALFVFVGNPYFDLLHGLVVGHLYYFFADVYPQVFGKDLLVTPHFLVDYFGVGQYTPDRPLRNPADARPDPTRAAGGGGGGHNWGGGGRPLGR